jgi:hypothetical protein
MIQTAIPAMQSEINATYSKKKETDLTKYSTATKVGDSGDEPSAESAIRDVAGLATAFTLAGREGKYRDSDHCNFNLY